MLPRLLIGICSDVSNIHIWSNFNKVKIIGFFSNIAYWSSGVKFTIFLRVLMNGMIDDK